MFRTLSFAHAHTHMQPTPPTHHNALLKTGCDIQSSMCSSWLRTPVFFCLHPPHCNITVFPTRNANATELGLNYKCYLNPHETKVSEVKHELGWYLHHCWRVWKHRDKGFFFFFSRSEEAVSESSSLSSCIPSISHTASWTRIGRQISTVISQQQRGCYIVWSRVILGPLWLLCGLWVWGCPHRCRLSTGFALCWLAELLNRLLDLFFLLMSPQAYMQSLAPCNVFQSIKSWKGGFFAHAPCLFYNSSHFKNPSILH